MFRLKELVNKVTTFLSCQFNHLIPPPVFEKKEVSFILQNILSTFILFILSTLLEQNKNTKRAIKNINEKRKI